MPRRDRSRSGGRMPPRPSIGWSGGSRKAAPARRRRRSATRCRRSTCPTSTAASSASSELTARGPVAVTFHRGHWCPFCRISINALVRAHEQVASTGGQIVAVMPERQQFVSDLARRRRRRSWCSPTWTTAMRCRSALRSGSATRCRRSSRNATAARVPGQRHLDAADSGDLRGRAGRPYQGAVCRSRLPQADGDRGSARRHAVLNARPSRE